MTRVARWNLAAAALILLGGHSGLASAQIGPGSWSGLPSSSSTFELVEPPADFEGTAGAEPSPGGAEPASPKPEPRDRGQMPWEAKVTYGWLSRAAIGADVSPLGIGIKAAVIAGPLVDLRLDGNFFSKDLGTFEVDRFRINPALHLRSLAIKADVYPFNSIWRLSGGLMLMNGNQITATGIAKGGSSFSINGNDYFSAIENPATGATPVTGNTVMGFHRHTPTFTVSGGFGRFIPRSKRHWSFPSEFGVVFTGAPTLDLNLAGWVCQDRAQTRCSNIADTANPVGAAFNQNLHTALTKWRRSLTAVQMYPIFSYGVVYSFGLR